MAEPGDPSPAMIARVLRVEGVVLGDEAVLNLVGTLRHELAGAGPLEPLLSEEEVTDVLVNSPHHVRVDSGAGLQPS